MKTVPVHINSSNVSLQKYSTFSFIIYLFIFDVLIILLYFLTITEQLGTEQH